MTKIKFFDIHFENDKKVYSPGDTIQGKVLIELDNEIIIRSLCVFMSGFAYVHWTETTGSGDNESTRFYTENYKYFYQRILLLGSDSIQNQLSMCQGKHQYSFQFKLPDEGISTSFEGSVGNIRYWLTAEIDRPSSSKSNNRVEQPFCVVCPLDTNLPKYRCQIQNSAETTVCSWCCASDLISMTMKTDRGAYCPDESIIISAEIENLSSRTIIPSAILIQKQFFFANGSTHFFKKKISQLQGMPIAGKSRSSWNRQIIKVPIVAPTINNCPILKVEYYVKIVLIIPYTVNLCMHLPIVLGTVPYQSLPVHPITTVHSSPNSTGIISEQTLMPSAPSMSSDGVVNIAYERENNVLDEHFINPPAYDEIYPHPDQEINQNHI